MIVVDTSALLAILNKEAERDRFLDILANEEQPVLSAVTYYEALLIVGIRRGSGNVDDLEQMIATVNAEIIPFDADQAHAAHAAYSRYGKGIDPAARLNLCDCVGYALARKFGVPLLYKGQDFAATDVVAAA